MSEILTVTIGGLGPTLNHPAIYDGGVIWPKDYCMHLGFPAFSEWKDWHRLLLELLHYTPSR